jgi:hypothetical protein
MLARSRPLALVFGAALLSAAACSDSTGVKGSLTAAESRALAIQMGTHMARGLSGSASAASAGGAQLNATPAPFSLSVNFEVLCPKGGKTRLKAAFSGQIENSTQSITADATGTNEPNDCGFDVEGKTIWVTGLLTSNAHVDVVNGVPVRENRASLEGSFRWRSSDGRSGNCDVAYTAKANYTTNVADVTGNFCGASIQFTGPLTS